MLPARLNVLAVISLASSFVVGLVGVVCGIVSLQQIKRSRERGRGLAIAGIVVGSVQTAAVTMLVIDGHDRCGGARRGALRVPFHRLGSRRVESIGIARSAPT